MSPAKPGRLRIITAGAGTGKTHRLGEVVREALTRSDDPVPPEQVMAITFTRAAAGELSSRLRQALLRDGHSSLAQRLAGARIGTVHAVLAQLVDEYAFELGLPPGLGVIDEQTATKAYEEALSSAMDTTLLARSAELERRWPFFSLAKEALEVHERAVANGLMHDELHRSAAASQAALRQAFPVSAQSWESTIESWRSTCAFLLERQAPLSPTASSARAVIDALRQHEEVAWQQLQSLERKGRAEHQASMAQHIGTTRFVDDLLLATELVFAAAAAGAMRYRDDKRAWAVLDFADLERYALQLLDHDQVRNELATRVSLVVVDEFQDTSPMQLAIFNRLTEIAAHTVFVGDEKQSIFGFRGAEPSLLAELMTSEHAAAERLHVARRQRPQMVRALSAVFVAAFAEHGGAVGPVPLVPWQHSEEIDLGAEIERWPTPREGEPFTIADGVAALIEEGVLVRDRLHAGVRPVQLQDIGILCQTKAHARSVAQALASRGIAAVSRRTGLGTTVAAQVMGHALRLWNDQGDDIAASHLLRLLQHPAAPTAWAAAVHASKDAPKGSRATLWFPSLVTAARAARGAGVIAAFDAVVTTLDLMTVLRLHAGNDDWVDELGDVRSLLDRIMVAERGRGRVATTGAFIEELARLADAPEDAQGQRAAEGSQRAVEVSTWHAAKGREWPIVILAQCNRSAPDPPAGVVVEREAEVGTSPLSGRWLRYIPNPYGAPVWGQDGCYFEVVRNQDHHQRRKREADREELRLLYVACTRARDRMVFVGEDPLWQRGAFRHLQVGGRPLISEEGAKSGRVVEWAGVPLRLVVREPAPPKKRSLVARSMAVPPRHEVQPWPPAFGQPSAAAASGAMLRSVELGEPFWLRNVANVREDLNRLGRCLHAYFAVDVVDNDDDRGLHRAAQHLLRFDCSTMLDAPDVHQMSRRLRTAMLQEFAPIAMRSEVPLWHRPNGATIWRGQIDLLVDHEGGAAIIDHKTTLEDDVSHYAGQLAAYHLAVEGLTGRPVTARIIYLPVQSRLVWLAQPPAHP
jgi:ATP-dependent helicase/nuclease subunit A